MHVCGVKCDPDTRGRETLYRGREGVEILWVIFMKLNHLWQKIWPRKVAYCTLLVVNILFLPSLLGFNFRCDRIKLRYIEDVYKIVHFLPTLDWINCNDEVSIIIFLHEYMYVLSWVETALSADLRDSKRKQQILVSQRVNCGQ